MHFNSIFHKNGLRTWEWHWSTYVLITISFSRWWPFYTCRIRTFCSSLWNNNDLVLLFPIAKRPFSMECIRCSMNNLTLIITIFLLLIKTPLQWNVFNEAIVVLGVGGRTRPQVELGRNYHAWRAGVTHSKWYIYLSMGVCKYWEVLVYIFTMTISKSVFDQTFCQIGSCYDLKKFVTVVG